MIFDAHTHLFSRWFYAALWRQKHGAGEPTEQQLLEFLRPTGLMLPPEDVGEHAAILVEGMDQHGVDRMVLFTSLPGEQVAVAAAVKAFPDRLVGYTMVNPHAPGSLDTARRDLTELGLRGIEIFPAMHRFDPSDEQLMYPVYELAAELGAVVFCHVGLLRVALREKLGLPSPFDMRFSDPMLLHRAAADFRGRGRGVNFILPHFGCGYLRETCLLGMACPNVYVDTSSSNGWRPPEVTLEQVLRRTLGAFGPDRILFGTDSSVLPRGYRADIRDGLEVVMEAMELSAEERGKIMGGNLARILRVG